ARAAGKEGYKVAVNYARSKDHAEAGGRDIVAGGGEAMAVQGGAASGQAIKAGVSAGPKAHGRPAALGKPTGDIGPPARGRGLASGAAISEVLTVNVASVFLCSREAVKRMSTAHGGKGGSIVNIGSAATRLGGSGEYVPYAASKGAINTLTIGLAKEVALEG